MRRDPRSIAPGGGLRVGVSSDGVRGSVSAARLADAARTVLRAEGVRDALLSVTLVSRSAMARPQPPPPRACRRHRRHLVRLRAGAWGRVVGDIYICPDMARDNAKAAGCGAREELLRLVVHGTLHVWAATIPGLPTARRRRCGCARSGCSPRSPDAQSAARERPSCSPVCS